MGFLSSDTLKNLEGKYVKFADGVVREFRLISHERLEADPSANRKYPSDVVRVHDMECGADKEFNADRQFMQELSRMNSGLDVGDIILVTPSTRQYTKADGSIGYGFNYKIEKKTNSPSF